MAATEHLNIPTYEQFAQLLTHLGVIAESMDIVEYEQEMSYTSEAWAVGTKNGIDVGSSDPQYHNNAKYYKEQAEAVAESIPEDYSELSDDVDQLKNAFNYLPYDVYDKTRIISGKYINSDGDETTHNTWNISQYFRVIEGETEYYLPSDYSSGVTSTKACFYDENFTVISTFSPGGAGWHSLVPVTNAKFVRFSIKIADIDDFKYYAKIAVPFEDNVIRPLMIKETNEKIDFFSSLIEGQYYSSVDGDPVDAVNWVRSPLYKAKQGDKITIKNAFGCRIVYFNSSLAFDSAVVGANTLMDTYDFVPANVAYFGLCILKSGLSEYECKLNDEIVGKKYVMDFAYLYPNTKWENKVYISHGDSITWQDGKEYQQGTQLGQIARGYQTIVKENLNLAWYSNYGKSGWSMAIANSNGIVNTIKAISNYKKYNLCTIACGTNDFKLNVPLGSIGQIGDTTFDDTTFYGAYRDSIEHILQSNSQIRMILMTPLQRNNDGYDVNTINQAGHKLIDYVNAVKALGVMYALPVCDMYSCSGITELTLSLYTMDGLHPNDIGYKRMGEYLSNSILGYGT